MSMFSKLNQIKELRSQAKKLQNELAQETVTVENKGIKMVMDGNQKIISLDIPTELLTPEKKGDLEKYLINTFADAQKKVQSIIFKKMKSSNFSLPSF